MTPIMSTKNLELVLTVLREVLVENGVPSIKMGPETRILEDTPLDSLQLALVVVKLEEATGKDPFSNGFLPFRTVGELAALYD